MRAPILALALFAGTVALGQTNVTPRIVSIDPVEITVGQGREKFMHITGSGFSLADHSVLFGGPAGSFELQASSGSSGSLHVWVPQEICATLGTHSVRVRVAGGGVSEPAYFEVVNGAPPVFHRPGTVSAEATGASGATASWTIHATAANGDDVPVICSHQSGALFPIGTTTVTCTATDSEGLTSETRFYVYVFDRTPPVLTIPDDILIDAVDGHGRVVTWEVSATDTVDANPRVGCNPDSGTAFPMGTTAVNCFAIDIYNNSVSRSFTITVVDSPRPILTLPDDIYVEAMGEGGAVVEFTATAIDMDQKPVPVDCSPASGSLFPHGKTVVTCTATDSDERISVGRFNVTVMNASILLDIPDHTTVPAQGPDGAIVHYETSAVDKNGNDVPVTCSLASGTLFPVGTTVVECFAREAHGFFYVTVTEWTGGGDTTTLELPDDITVEATDDDGAIVTFTATARDSNGNDVPVTCTPASGTKFPIGTTVVTCTAREASGTFNVTVTEPPPPDTTTLELPDDITVEATDNDGAIVTFTATARDSKGNDVPVTCTPASGTKFPIGTTVVTCTAREASGTFNVTVTEPPPDTTTLDLPDDITVEATDNDGAVVTFTATARDSKGNDVPVTCTPASGTKFPIGTTVVTCTAREASGTFNVTVTEPPPDTTTLDLPDDITVEATDNDGAVVTFTATARDSKGNDVPVTCTPASGTKFPIGTTVVTCTAREASGTFNVTVTEPPPPPDTTAPVIARISASPDILWPIDNKFTTVRIHVEATDDTDPSPVARVIRIDVNEPATGDTRITGPLTVELRATRAGQAEERIYTITVEVTDASGNGATGTVQVRVPHDSGGSRATVKQAPKRKTRRSAGGT